MKQRICPKCKSTVITWYEITNCDTCYAEFMKQKADKNEIPADIGKKPRAKRA